jgi:hypothetical protein
MIGMLEGAFGAEAFSVEEDSAESEGGVVGDAEAPVRRDPTLGILQIAFHDRQEAPDLLPAGRMCAQPSVSPHYSRMREALSVNSAHKAALSPLRRRRIGLRRG